ncbi:MAG: hypothetical protein H7249_07755 [Chitinophagaceae bacterium]|nr:hypothetical protein [Oligoflexus sp.]
MTLGKEDRDLTLASVANLLDIHEHNQHVAQDALTLLANRLESDKLKEHIKSRINPKPVEMPE